MRPRRSEGPKYTQKFHDRPRTMEQVLNLVTGESKNLLDALHDISKGYPNLLPESVRHRMQALFSAGSEADLFMAGYAQRDDEVKDDE